MMIPLRLEQPKANKYRNTPVVVDGIRFDSKRESIRYHALRLLEKSGDIRNLRRQVRFDLHADGPFGVKKIGSWVADFTYMDMILHDAVAEDVKSPATAKNALFRWKRKHFEAEYGVKIKVTK